MIAAPRADLSLRIHAAPLQPDPATVSITLPSAAVDVWSAELTDQDLADSTPTEAWEALLAPEELGRSRRFHFAPDLRRYVYGRGLLRWLLGAYLDLDPARVQFVCSAHGKPELAPALVENLAKRRLHFNLSHSGSRVLLAFAWERHIGVDVEQVRHDIEVEQIAGRFFSRAEQDALQSLESASRIPAFFRCWTRKEAYVKAKGQGLALPLDQFDVSLLPGEPAALLATRPDAGEATRWALHGLEAGPEYAAAVAVERLPARQLS
jgi:4'-phosphopantetheinyl transferase